MKQTRWYVMIDPDGVISYFEKLNRHQFGQKYWFHNKYVNSFERRESDKEEDKPTSLRGLKYNYYFISGKGYNKYMVELAFCPHHTNYNLYHGTLLLEFDTELTDEIKKRIVIFRDNTNWERNKFDQIKLFCATNPDIMTIGILGILFSLLVGICVGLYQYIISYF